jgi:putative peptidoglycan lipid II flippase
MTTGTMNRSTGTRVDAETSPPASAPFRRLVSAAVAVSLCTLVVKAVAGLKELAIAYRFGRGDDVDAFVMAFLVPSFAINVLGASFGVAFIPAYLEEARRGGAAAAQRLLESIASLSALTLVVATPVVVVLAYLTLPAFASSFDPAKVHLTRTLLALLAPCLIFAGVGNFLGSVLQARERFIAPALAPIITPLLTALLLWTAGPRVGIQAVAVVTTAGGLLEALVQWLVLRSRGVRVRLARPSLALAARRVLRQYAHVAIGAFVGSAQTVVDSAMAAHLGRGSAAALAYASKMPALVLGLAGGLWTVAFPRYAELVAAGDRAGLRAAFRRHALACALVSLPLTAGLFFLSEPLAHLIFQRGAFVASDTAVVARVQAFYFLQIPFYMLYMLVARLLSALGANAVLMKGAVLYLAVDVVLNLLFMRAWGTSGIALSTAFVMAVSLGYAYGSLRVVLAKQAPSRPPQ